MATCLSATRPHQFHWYCICKCLTVTSALCMPCKQIRLDVSKSRNTNQHSDCKLFSIHKRKGSNLKQKQHKVCWFHWLWRTKSQDCVHKQQLWSKEEEKNGSDRWRVCQQVEEDQSQFRVSSANYEDFLIVWARSDVADLNMGLGYVFTWPWNADDEAFAQPAAPSPHQSSSECKKKEVFLTVYN